MFSQLGPLFKTQFRQAESNDTRQYIPHEERDKGRKKQDDPQQKQTHDEAWIDNASVSVGALRAFLIDFLKTIPGGEDGSFIRDHKNSEEQSNRPKEQKRPSNTHNARAVRAYQTMAAHSSSKNDSPPPQDPDLEKAKNNEPTADKLESKELRDIHGLIIDLEYLEKRGVTTLNIFQADSFVKSLQNAVTLAKSKV